MNLDTVVGRRRTAPSSPDPRRHQRKCSICNHKDREAIDADFLLWRPAHEIVRQYAIAHRSFLYRHAEATGLTARRKQYFRTALESIIEEAESAPVTGATIIRAIRAYSCLRDDGRWVDLPKRIVVDRRGQPTSTPPSRSTAAKESSSSSSGAVAPGLRQGTASAVPNSTRSPGVLTPEGIASTSRISPTPAARSSQSTTEFLIETPGLENAPNC